MSIFPHCPVLLNEVIALFSPLSIKTFVDGTLGAGGHAEAILQHHPEIECYLGIDQDPSALRIAEKRLLPWKEKLKLHQGNFSEIYQIIDLYKLPSPEGILVDLGVSSMQLDEAHRGFSFMREGPLDMRMNPEVEITAADIVNTFSEEQLAIIFREYGEEKQWRKATRLIVEARQKKLFKTTEDLKEVLLKPLSRFDKKGIHPLTLVFQALRIAVNRELDVLKEFLPEAIHQLRTGGRLVVISFHSLEDRIVKETFRFAASDKYETSGLCGLFRNKAKEALLLTRKPLEASDSEVSQNPRSRCAKLRALQKCEG